MKSVWLKARELKLGKLGKLKYLGSAYLILEIPEIRLRVFLKFLEIFFKKCQNFV
jgi:hypothetical protein